MKKNKDIVYKTTLIPLKCNKTDFEYIKTLNKISADKLQKIADEDGLKKLGEYFCKDHTHTSIKGAHLNAQGIAEGLKDVNCPLKEYLK